MDLIRLEHKLKQRLSIPYKWERVQNDVFDKKTDCIYSIYGVNKLLNELQGSSDSVINYALNRWFNFHSAQGVEYIFSSHPKVMKHKNRYHQSIDFYIDGIEFDHKTTVLPKCYNNNIEKALNDKRGLIEWLYANQSQQRRCHHKNRLFILVFDSVNLEHWKMKAEIQLIKNTVESYLNEFKRENLTELNINGEKILSDVLFIIK